MSIIVMIFMPFPSTSKKRLFFKPTCFPTLTRSIIFCIPSSIETICLCLCSLYSMLVRQIFKIHLYKRFVQSSGNLTVGVGIVFIFIVLSFCVIVGCNRPKMVDKITKLRVKLYNNILWLWSFHFLLPDDRNIYEIMTYYTAMLLNRLP